MQEIYLHIIVSLFYSFNFTRLFYSIFHLFINTY